jgi:hypothetical protein
MPGTQSKNRTRNRAPIIPARWLTPPPPACVISAGSCVIRPDRCVISKDPCVIPAKTCVICPDRCVTATRALLGVVSEPESFGVEGPFVRARRTHEDSIQRLERGHGARRNPATHAHPIKHFVIPNTLHNNGFGPVCAGPASPLDGRLALDRGTS